MPDLDAARLVELAAARGVKLDPASAEKLRPLVASLLGRLRRLSESLGRDAAPAPEHLPADRAP